MESVRNLMESTIGKVIAIVVIIGMCWGLYVEGRHTFSPLASLNGRIFVDSATGKGFTHELVKGELVPIVAPSGGNTGYPAELCYWNKDGTWKDDPTPVLLNSWIGKSGPTFCPDCGRLVVPNNPRGGPGMKPPPTEAEYNILHRDDR